MAKPIPVNRRFLENRKQAQASTHEPSTPPVRSHSDYRDALRELIAIIRVNSHSVDESLWEETLEQHADAEDDRELAVVSDATPSHEDGNALVAFDEDDIFTPEELVEAYAEPVIPARVIAARFASGCVACGNPIRVGDPITRHARWGNWVHVDCCQSQSRAPFRSLVARYSGVCRLCRQPILQGATITMLRGYGWVHLECARKQTDAL